MKKSSSTFAKVIAWIFLTAAGLALYGAVFELWHSISIQQNWSRAEGTVTRVTTFTSSSNSRRGSGKSRFSIPHVVFTASDGRHYEVKGHAGEQVRPRRPLSNYRGQKLPILYPPENPQRGIIYSRAELYSLSLVFLVFGLAAGAFGGAILYFSPREAPKVRAESREENPAKGI